MHSVQTMAHKMSPALSCTFLDALCRGKPTREKDSGLYGPGGPHPVRVCGGGVEGVGDRAGDGKAFPTSTLLGDCSGFVTCSATL